MKNWKNGTAIAFWCTISICALVGSLCFAQKRWGLTGIVIAFFVSETPLQIFKIVYEAYAKKTTYCENLVNSITRCWICYNILNSVILTSLLYVFLMAAAQEQWLGLSTNWYFVIILVISCVLSLWSINSFKRRGKDGNSSPTSIIYAYAPRFVIMLAFVVFYCIKYINDITPEELLPALFVVYLGVDRMYNMMIGVRCEARDSYKTIYEDTESWIKKERKLE